MDSATSVREPKAAWRIGRRMPRVRVARFNHSASIGYPASPRLIAPNSATANAPSDMGTNRYHGWLRWLVTNAP